MKYQPTNRTLLHKCVHSLKLPYNGSNRLRNDPPSCVKNRGLPEDMFHQLFEISAIRNASQCLFNLLEIYRMIRKRDPKLTALGRVRDPVLSKIALESHLRLLIDNFYQGLINPRGTHPS